MSRQKLIRMGSDHRVGCVHLVFLKSGCSARATLEKKEWVQFIGSVLTFMLGTINVRMAACVVGA
jgi:hypothetical protein